MSKLWDYYQFVTFFHEANYPGWKDFFSSKLEKKVLARKPFSLHFSMSSCFLCLVTECRFWNFLWILFKICCHRLVWLQVLTFPLVPSFPLVIMKWQFMHRYFSKQEAENNLWSSHPTIRKRKGILKFNNNEFKSLFYHLCMTPSHLIFFRYKWQKDYLLQKKKISFWKIKKIAYHLSNIGKENLLLCFYFGGTLALLDHPTAIWKMISYQKSHWQFKSKHLIIL